MSIFTTFFDKVKTSIDTILSELFGDGKALVEAIEPMIKSQLATTLADLITRATPIVTALAADPTLSGLQKQASAAQQLLAGVVADGKTAGTADVNFAIEAAVQNVTALATQAVATLNASAPAAVPQAGGNKA